MPEMQRKRPLPQRYRAESERQTSSRGISSPNVPGVNTPGMPQGAWSQPHVVITPEVVANLSDVIAKGIQEAFDRYSVYIRSKSFDYYDLWVVPVGVAPVRLDPQADAQKERRALLIQNLDAATDLTVGKSPNLVAGQGFQVNAGGGTYLVSIHEREPHYGIVAAGQINVAVVWYS